MSSPNTVKQPVHFSGTIYKKNVRPMSITPNQVGCIIKA